MGQLWAGSSPATQPSGLLLDITHQSPAEAAFTAVAFNPTDPTRFVFGDSTGAIFHVAMKKNKFVVSARLTSAAAVTSIAYLMPTGGGSNSSGNGTVLAASAAQLHVIDLDTGRVEQRVLRTPHQQRITQVLVSPFKKNFAVTISADCVALWETAPLKCSHHSTERRGLYGDVAMRFGSFVGVALAVCPAETMEELKKADLGDADAHGTDNKTVNNTSVFGEAAGDVDGTNMHNLSTAAAHAAALTDGPPPQQVVVTLEAEGFLTLWSLTAAGGFAPMKRIDIAPFKPTGAIAACESFIIVGTKQGKLLCFSTALDAISSVDVPGGAPIVGTSLVDGRVIACQLATGPTWFVNAADYSVLFSLAYPSPSAPAPRQFAAPDATYSAIVTPSAVYIHHLPTAKAHYERTAHGTSARGKMRQQNVLYPFAKDSRERLAGVPTNTSHSHHLRSGSMRGGGGVVGVGSLKGGSSLSSSSTAASQHQRHYDPAAAAHEASMAAHSEAPTAALPRQILKVEDAHVREWIKVNLVHPTGAPAGIGGGGGAANGVSVTAPKTLRLVDAVREMTRDDVSDAYRAGGTSASSTTAAAGRRGYSSNGRGSSSSGAYGSRKKSNSSAAASSNKTRKAQEDEAAVISLRGFLDHDSRVANMDKLRALLLRYGSYPDRYRPLIWRFLLQLPEKRFTEAQFANLAAKGPHPAVRTLMAPFPLPETKLRNSLFNTLSALAWHSPVFSAVHFIPNIVFPFVKLFSSDIQSSVEVLLAFLINWGQEFFVYYPHPPVSVVSFVSHTLRLLTPALHAHLAACGVGPDVFVWDVMASLYTEVLTRGEWLQVMDHAFANEPVWLLLFHVCLLAHLEGPLSSLSDHAQIVAMLRRPTPLDLPLVIQNTYQLQRRYVQSDLSHPYRRLNTFGATSTTNSNGGNTNGADDVFFRYPSVMECNESIITSRVRELERLQAHESRVLNMRDRIAHVKKQLVQAAMLEDAFVGKQKAAVAAQFEATNDVWVQQVQLEKERQKLRDVEHEARLGALQEQLRSAHRIEAMQRELHAAAAATRDAEIDRQREVMKWDFADRMANTEMERLEAGARMKLASVIHSAEALAAASQAQQQQFLNAMRRGEEQRAADGGDGGGSPIADDGSASFFGGSVHLGATSHQTGSPISSKEKDSYAGVISSRFGSARASQVVSPPFPHELPPHQQRSAGGGGAAAFFGHSASAEEQNRREDEAAAAAEYHRHQSSTYADEREAAEAEAERGHVSSTTDEQQTGSSDSAKAAAAARNSHSHQEHQYNTVDTSTTASGGGAHNHSAAAIAADPVGYYRCLQEEIRHQVAQSQRQQQATIASLNSRYARALLHDDDDDNDDYNAGALTEVTEPVCDDTSVDENANNNVGGLPQRPSTSLSSHSANFFGGGRPPLGAQQHHSSSTVSGAGGVHVGGSGARHVTKTVTTTTTTVRSGGASASSRHAVDYSHSDAPAEAARALAAAARYERGSSVGSDTTQSSSMTRAILRPHERGYYGTK